MAHGTDAYTLEVDGTSHFLMEDGSGVLILESASAVLKVPGPTVVDFAVSRSYNY